MSTLPLKHAFLGVALVFAVVRANVYHVSPSGSDSETGSSSQPFRTIAKASGVVTSGDTCYIHAGTYYYDYLRPLSSGSASSPIVFVGAGDGEVVIHGGEKITGWTRDAGSVYRATVNSGREIKELFVNRRHMLWARYPNMPYDPESGFDMFYPKIGTPETPPPGVDWRGVISIVDEGTGWVNRITRRNSYVSDNRGILVGVRGLLDSEGEWHQEGSTLLLWAPGGADPNNLTIETQVREFAVDLGSRDYIVVRGITVFGSSISMNDSRNCEVTDCKVLYPCPLFLTTEVKNSGWLRDDSGAVFSGVGKGVTVGGSNNKFAHSEVGFSWGDGVTVYGTGNDISDCHIHDCDWSKTDAAGVSTGGSGNIVRHNTMHHFGRSGVNIRKTAALKLLYNDVHHSGLMSHDLGPVYAGWIGPRAAGTEIAYNWLHDDQSGGNGARGVYLDPETYNFLVHHNVIWNLPPGNYACALTTGTGDCSIYNNSCFNSQGARPTSVMSDPTLKLCNNVLELSLPFDPSTIVADVRGNLSGWRKVQYRNPAGYDWRLRDQSPCIDTGVAIPGITDGFLGRAPDAGAYEYGAPRWEAGVGTGPDYAAKPVITPERRHSVPCQVAMNTSTSGAQIRYTTDGSEPTASSVLYSQPFALNADALIKARAFGTGLRPSRTETASFTVPRDAFSKIEAESADAWYFGKVDSSGGRGYLAEFQFGEWVLFESVDFGAGASSVSIEYFASRGNWADTILLRLDGCLGEKIGVIKPPPTDSVYQVATAPLWRTVSGVHDVHVTVQVQFTMGRWDWMRFSSNAAASNPISVNPLASPNVRIAVCDLMGRTVADIRGMPYAAAMSRFRTMARQLGASAYVVTVTSGGRVLARKKRIDGIERFCRP